MKFILRKKDLILKKNQFIRKLFLKCYNEKRAIEWRLSILHILYTNAQKFLVSQPFNSFAPVRDESLVKWFVDGSDYMEAVADSIDQAKQEIFITGFFLSPEIYLKRPVIQGDKWRLDKLLQRKAVYKIFILIPSIVCFYSNIFCSSFKGRRCENIRSYL